MTKAIWKFPLRIDDRQIVRMPRDAVILSCQFQDGILCLWAEVDPLNSRTDRTFAVVGTGHPYDFYGTFIATAQQPPFVWHVFEVFKK